MPAPTAVAREYAARLEEMQVKSSGEAVKRYMKTGLECYGVCTPKINILAKEWVAQKKSMGETVELCNELHNMPIFETRLLAMNILRAMPRSIDTGVVESIEHWYDSMDNWAHCDTLSVWIVGRAILKDPELLKRTRAWTTHDNKWRRRASVIVPLLLYRAGKGHPEATFRQLDILHENNETEYFVIKTYDWVLKDIGRRFPEKLHTYLLENGRKYKKAQIKKSIKYLPEEMKMEIIQCCTTSS